MASWQTVLSETDLKGLAKSDNFKKLVAGEAYMGEDKGTSLEMIKSFARIVMALDDVTGVSDMGYGFQTRLVVLDFPNTFLENEQDIYLTERY